MTVQCDFCEFPAVRISSSGEIESKRFTCALHRLEGMRRDRPLHVFNDYLRTLQYDSAFAELQRQNGKKKTKKR